MFLFRTTLHTSKIAKGLICVGLGLSVANCASNTKQAYNNKSSEIGAFPQAKYGQASERVVADGEPVPKGGGRYQVGKPYSVAGRTYVPREMNGQYSAVGMSSWYGDAFHGRRTANGEVYDKNSFTAAHPTMPLPSYARVTNMSNGYSMIVRVNDRGPYHGGRVMDVSERVASTLDFKSKGTARIRVEHLGAAGIAGSDDRKLLASLSTTGQPAALPGSAPQVQIASSEPRYMPASATIAPYMPPAPVVQVAPRISSQTQISSVPKPVISDEEQAAIEAEKEPTPVSAPLRGVEPIEPVALLKAEGNVPAHIALKAIPLPPQRPYNLSSIASPIKTGASNSASFYAEPEALRGHFGKNDPFAKLNTLNSNSFKK